MKQTNGVSYTEFEQFNGEEELNCWSDVRTTEFLQRRTRGFPACILKLMSVFDLKRKKKEKKLGWIKELVLETASIINLQYLRIRL